MICPRCRRPLTRTVFSRQNPETEYWYCLPSMGGCGKGMSRPNQERERSEPVSGRILIGHVLDVLPTLEAGSVQCCVTSPPYYGLRDYGVDGQIGLEPTVEAYVEAMVQVFRAVRRVLRDDGTLWLNLGDSYASKPNGPSMGGSTLQGSLAPHARVRLAHARRSSGLPGDGIKHKDLIGIPWRVAFALQADGWYLRSDIIWHKPNPMPESVTDRPTKAHEYVFLLSKQERYFYDADAIREVTGSEMSLEEYERRKALTTETWYQRQTNPFTDGRKGGKPDGGMSHPNGRNRRSVWTVATQPYPDAHFATYPEELIEPCILAGTSEKGQCPACGKAWQRVVERTAMVIDRSSRTHPMGRTRTSGTMVEPPHSETTGWKPGCDCNAGEPVPQTVLDVFLGSGTTGAVCNRLARHWVGIELNPAYADLAAKRTAQQGFALEMPA